jgi:DNA-binding response OmpR family regulator
VAIEVRARHKRNRSAGLRVLVVEDWPDIADSLAMLLELHQHQVRVANDGKAAIDAAVAFAPQVVLIDIGLPGADGYEVARRLRAQHVQSDLHLIALTGYVRAGDERLSRESVFDHYIVKPVDPDQIIALLETYRRSD